MRNITVHACALIMLAGSTLFAQQPAGKLPPDLEALPTEIKTLKWQQIDPATLSTLDRCRSLLLMNHVLDELVDNATAEADLMSSYIEKKNLGSQFANTPPPPQAPHLSYDDAQKVAAALLKGPMSASYYATELGDVSETGLASYEQLYSRTCARRWSELDEARAQVSAMSSFLGNSNRLPDYEAWAIAEASLRQQQYEKKVGPAAAQKQSNAEIQALQKQNQMLQQALGAAEYQQRSAAQQTAQAQQAAAQAQQAATQAQQQASQSQQQTSQQQQPAGYVVPTYGAYGYGAYGGYGYGYGAAAGAYAANEHNAASYAAGAYHGANSAWTHEAGYSGQARAQTEQRMNSFHGAPGGFRR